MWPEMAFLNKKTIQKPNIFNNCSFLSTFVSSYTFKSLFSTFLAQCPVVDDLHVFTYPSCHGFPGYLMMRYGTDFLEFVKRSICHNLHIYAHARGDSTYFYIYKTQPALLNTGPGNPLNCAPIVGHGIILTTKYILILLVRV